MMGIAISTLFRQKLVMLGAVIFVSAVAAIIFERALNDMILNYMHPLSVLGLAIVVLGMVPILASIQSLHIHAWVVIAIGITLVAVGFIIGVPQALNDSVSLISLNSHVVGV